MATIEDLGRKVKAKYAGHYDDLSDAEVGRKVKAKFPGQYDDFTEVKSQHWADRLGLTGTFARGAVDLAEGAASGAASTVFQGGDLLRRFSTGYERVIDKPEVKQAMKAPESFMGGAGKFLEQTAELAVPLTKISKATAGMSLLKRALAEGAGSAGVAAVQSGGDPAHVGIAGTLGAAAPAVSAVAKPAVAGLSERLYQSALKPTWQMFKDEGQELIRYGLKLGIPVNQNGLARVNERIVDLGHEIEQGIIKHSAQGRTVDSSKVLSAMDELEHFYRNTATPKEALDRLAAIRKEFVQFHGQQIPIGKAQQLKVNTYRELKTAYGEMKAAKIEGLKQVTRGLKEEIEQVFPEISGLNAEQSKALGLEQSLERALWRIENHQMLGLGSPAAAAAGGAMMGKTGAAMGLMSKYVFDHPALKSKLAIRLAKAGNPNPMGTVNKRMASLKSAWQESFRDLAATPTSPSVQLAPAMAQ